MSKHSNTGNRVTKWLRWIARIWSSPIILYALMLAIGYTWNWVTIGEPDPYAVEDSPFVEALPPIFMFISILGLGIAWRWEGVGGLITLVFQLPTLVLLLIQRPLTHDFRRFVIPYLLSLIITAPGVLFLVCWWRLRRVPTSQKGQ